MGISNELANALPSGVFDKDANSLDAMRLLGEAVNCVRAVDPDLDLSSLVGLYVRERYADALADLSGAVGQQVTATNNQDGVGFAMVFPAPDGEHLAVALEILLGAFSPQEKLRATARNVLHHELCHIHDGAVHRRTVPSLRVAAPTMPDPKTAWLFPFGHDIWAEYYADRRSHTTRLNGENHHLPSLEAAVARFPNEVRSALGDLSDEMPGNEAIGMVNGILADVGPRLENLCRHLGYVMGTHAASTCGEAPSPLAVSQTPWLSAAWGSLEAHLESLYRTHGEWSGVEVFFPLVKDVERLLEGAGMKLFSAFGRCLVAPLKGERS